MSQYVVSWNYILNIVLQVLYPSISASYVVFYFAGVGESILYEFLSTSQLRAQPLTCRADILICAFGPARRTEAKFEVQKLILTRRAASERFHVPSNIRIAISELKSLKFMVTFEMICLFPTQPAAPLTLPLCGSKSQSVAVNTLTFLHTQPLMYSFFKFPAVPGGSQLRASDGSGKRGPAPPSLLEEWRSSGFDSVIHCSILVK